MHLTKEEVKKVAALANLPINDEDLERYASQLSAILDYIDQLNQVDTTNIEPTFNVSNEVNVMRGDEQVPCLTQEGALQNASAKKNGMFAVKRVLGGGE